LHPPGDIHVAVLLTGDRDLEGHGGVQAGFSSPWRAQSWTEGFHHRTEIKKISRMGAGYHMKDGKLVKNNTATEYSLADGLYSPWMVSKRLR